MSEKISERELDKIRKFGERYGIADNVTGHKPMSEEQIKKFQKEFSEKWPGTKDFPIVQPLGNMNVYEQLSHRIDELQCAMKMILEVQTKLLKKVDKLEQWKSDHNEYENWKDSQR